MLAIVDLKDLGDDLESAEDRLARHLANERERKRAGLRSDMERYLAGEETAD